MKRMMLIAAIVLAGLMPTALPANADTDVQQVEHRRHRSGHHHHHRRHFGRGYHYRHYNRPYLYGYRVRPPYTYYHYGFVRPGQVPICL
jgi:hypothetical protein